MRSSTDGEVNTEKYSEDLRTLQQEQEKNKPSKKTVRHLMKTTYEGIYIHIFCAYNIYNNNICIASRRQWLLSEESPSLVVILEHFPSMRKIQFV